ncbi:type III-B CRISPR module RAMP protein Cmr6 [Gemmata algarum]|uniref:type III-B CRISPR module RAMP protein Cmr6 n=1 Tax=Gemmata algarum TaxID=2975278 RepID=UPI002A74B914|nr:type III-B CRISPR module RAMP protein Cmr6 [Gemmata algarum]
MIEQIVRLSNDPPLSRPEFDLLFSRWKATIGSVGFTGKTAGPLTLHLTRASALENAGICLHRIYGFVYLPGTGLKGLARSFACEVWLGEQPNKAAAWQKINAVFGAAPSPWLNDLAKRHEQPVPKEASVGAVVFHDAWPERWPRLVTDILNNHHTKYYSDGAAPGDWEDPVPVYFLSVEPGTPFRFAVAPRRNDADSAELVTLAREWLIGGLTQLGAGAKTASGYGDFIIEEPEIKPIRPANRPTFTATLELVTPAFLAGAKQQADDCDLRPSTLRGQLRWWWRTLHAGFVSVDDLRKMEAAIWGDTKTGGAVRVTVREVPGTRQVSSYDRRQVIRHHRIPQPTDGSIPGLAYHSYGMDDAKGRRHYVEPGAKWKVAVTARTSRFADKVVSSEIILRQATTALQLLPQFGGVGAKSRKGFGSFADLSDFDLGAVRRVATEYRTACGFGENEFSDQLALSPSLQLMLGPVEIPTEGTNSWVALNELAASVQQFVKWVQPKHCRRWLGLPRRLRGATGPRVAHESRHASPAVFHFARAADGCLVARVVAFPAAELPNVAESRHILGDLLKALQSDLPQRFDAIRPPPQSPPSPRPAGLSKRPSGTLVQVSILGKRVKGGFDVQEAGRNPGTLTLGTPTPGADTGDGKPVMVWILDDKPDKPQYKWPDAPKQGKK